MSTFDGIRVVVAGAGVSGCAAAEALIDDGAIVTITDANAQRLGELTELARRSAGLVENLTAVGDDTELVVTSPGWKPSTPLLRSATESDVEVIGEVELAWRMNQARPSPSVWLAVTGTNGKTTTVGMLESMLRAAGLDAVACGNVGLPAVRAVRAGHRVLAVELSSFQLHWSCTLRPHGSVVLNVADDHLDWHGGLHEYAHAKGLIYRGASLAVFNAEDTWSRWLCERFTRPDTRRVGFTLAQPGLGQLGVTDGEDADGAGDTAKLVDRAFTEEPTVLAETTEVHPDGPHHRANALAAAALARGYGVEASAVTRGLRAFQPGDHRSVVVADVDGVTYVDDSKATNPHAAAAALRAHERVVWIAGGLLKGADIDGLIAEVAERLDAAVLIGADREVIALALRRHAPNVPLVEVETGDDGAMLTAVRSARDFAERGSAVLLAPAAASMDMFTDYAARGRAFVEAVRTVTGHGSP